MWVNRNLHNSLPLFTQILCVRSVSRRRAKHENNDLVHAISKSRSVLMETNEVKSWEELYVAAVLETDPAKIAGRLDIAQDALRERWHALRQVPRARDPEKLRVEDAIRTLNMIRLNEFDPPA